MVGGLLLLIINGLARNEVYGKWKKLKNDPSQQVVPKKPPAGSQHQPVRHRLLPMDRFSAG
jgi:hypothetical protein